VPLPPASLPHWICALNWAAASACTCFAADVFPEDRGAENDSCLTQSLWKVIQRTDVMSSFSERVTLKAQRSPAPDCSYDLVEDALSIPSD